MGGEELDWAEEWRRRYLATMEVRGTANYYDEDERARKYYAMEYLWKDGEARVARLDLRPQWTAIDVGSGPGIMTVPLARRCSRVTVVEPSRPMVSLLQGRMRQEGLENVSVVRARWEEAEGLEPHDVVVASFCLLMEDIRAAVLKMNDLAREWVHIYWFAGVTYWERARMDLYPLVHGRPHSPGPKVDLLYNLLYHEGIYPDMEVLEAPPAPEPPLSLEQAVADLRELMELKDGRHDRELEEYVKRRYRFQEGRYARPDGTIRVRLSWRPGRKGYG